MSIFFEPLKKEIINPINIDSTIDKLAEYYSISVDELKYYLAEILNSDAETFKDFDGIMVTAKLVHGNEAKQYVEKIKIRNFLLRDN